MFHLFRLIEPGETHVRRTTVEELLPEASRFGAVLHGSWSLDDRNLCFVLEGDGELPTRISSGPLDPGIQLDLIGSFDIGGPGTRPPTKVDINNPGGRPPTGLGRGGVGRLDIGDPGGRPPT